MKPTQEQVIAWAREAGLSTVYAVIAEHDDGSQTIVDHRPFLERFATLAYEAGRKDEAEIAVAEAYRCGYDAGRKDENEACAEEAGYYAANSGTARNILDAIRARREQ